MQVRDVTSLDPSDLQGQSILLEGIEWETYKALRRNLDREGRNTRLTYDEGRLWIMSPSPTHDRLKKLIARMIELFAVEHRIPLSGYGSTTWRPTGLKKGLEPDECYYVQSEPLVRGKDHIDLKRDPPPDLAIEVELTHPLVDRIAIYASLGVPEVWHYRQGHLRAMRLRRGRYMPTATSLALPSLKPAELERFLEIRHTMDETSLMVSFQEWARSLRDRD